MSTNSERNGAIGLYSLAGWSAILSGVIGFLAYRFLVGYLNQRFATPEAADLLLRWHDGGVILQFLLLIPVVNGLRQLSQKHSPGLSRRFVIAGIVALTSVILLLVLNFPKIVWDALYMFPQGAFGVWLMVLNCRTTGLLPGWLRASGFAVGFGLLLVGLFPPGYAIFVDPICLRVPAARPEDFPETFSAANAILHRILFVGFYLGVTTLPFWSALLGWRLLRQSTRESTYL